MRIVFMGTPEFAVPSFKMLVEQNFNIVAAITQPDKPKGRGKKLSMPPVKEFALANNIPVLQPEKIKTFEFFKEISALKPELLITVAYGKILPKDVLGLPRFGCINVHASLLPKYRGAAPINWAIINGEKVTGITTMYTDVGMDTGDMLLKSEVDIADDMTSLELHDRLSNLGAKVLKDTLECLKNGTLIRTPQIHEQATYAPLMTKTIGNINWEKPNKEIHNLVRGTNPWPSAYTFYKQKKLKVIKTRIKDYEKQNLKPGTIISVGKDYISVSTLDGVLDIVELQFEDSKQMTVKEYLLGHKICDGEILE